MAKTVIATKKVAKKEVIATPKKKPEVIATPKKTKPSTPPFKRGGKMC